MRLIDADNYCKNLCKCNSTECDKAKCPILNAQTAYDQDKVVEQLETLRKECEDPLQDYCPNYFIDRAVDFVKGGGVNDEC